MAQSMRPKYEAVPGRVGMEECSLDLTFFKKNRDRRTLILVFCLRAMKIFSNSLNLILF